MKGKTFTELAKEVGLGPLTVEIKETKGLYLRQSIAHGTTESGEEFEVDSCIPDASILVTFNKKDQYILKMKSVVDAVVRYRGPAKARQEAE